MTMKRRTPSRLIETVHETARDLQTAGFIDKRRMREYDALCFAPLHPSPFPPHSSAACGSTMRYVLHLSHPMRARTFRPYGHGTN